MAKGEFVRWIIWHPNMSASFAATKSKDVQRIASLELGAHWKEIRNAGWRCTKITLGGEDDAAPKFGGEE